MIHLMLLNIAFFYFMCVTMMVLMFVRITVQLLYQIMKYGLLL